MLQRIFDNLVINAFKHGHGDIEIKISTDKEICYQFKNQIKEPINVEYIFDEFYTCDISQTKQNTGLGLAIVNEFTKILGGRVIAEVENNSLLISLIWNKNSD